MRLPSRWPASANPVSSKHSRSAAWANDDPAMPATSASSTRASCRQAVLCFVKPVTGFDPPSGKNQKTWHELERGMAAAHEDVRHAFAILPEGKNARRWPRPRRTLDTCIANQLYLPLALRTALRAWEAGDWLRLRAVPGTLRPPLAPLEDPLAPFPARPPRLTGFPLLPSLSISKRRAPASGATSTKRTSTASPN